MLIREKDKTYLLQLFSSIQLPVEVWAYGSRVNGTAHAGSDLDLVVRTEQLNALPKGVLNYLRDDIQNSNIPILVELRDLAMLPKSFHDNILQCHEVLFKSE